ncbi:1-phosphatidylinositol 4,5-bisphosphate phosphodiesterase classes I and II-like isoform X4 [Portunus trituberculatus]|uniref:1-phosphatidylinositol 4,5-bisphosphate phosphodiesterase classes I and II-like isoform X4 n=1 Tax=Portunus trituberculatus TaxID=210409 RepID=UPI001E1D0A98|nr:1-phosphatidylinositol 4,5-bisphosphate phosphodiesterase classes I and II-like isoform X4 [Portunus trituberculatus]
MASAKSGVHVLKLKHITVPQQLQDGDKFVKWEEDSSAGIPVTLKVDPQGFYLYWKNSSNADAETEVLDIMTIRDTRRDKFAKVPKDPKLTLRGGGSTELMEPKCLTIVHGNSFVDVSFCNFIAQKPEIAKLWADEILRMAYNLVAINASPITFLNKAYTRLKLATDRNNKISVKNIIKLFARHGDDRKKVETALDAAGVPSGKNDTVSTEKFTWEMFLQFYHKLTNRLEVERVFCSLTDQEYNPDPKFRPRGMNIEQLVKFLNEEQRDPRLNEILYPYADAAKAKEVIRDYEPAKENIAKNVLSIEGFLKYLMSDENTVISMEMADQYADMEQPLSHYFINSSHNTYLTGHQFTGKASIEMYRQCLLAGCRCVELDFWNGKLEEPVIVHGFTLVPEISAKDVIESIAESAFKTSDWPVILSFENHCNPRQQAKIANYCREFFGDMLLDSPLDNFPLEAGVPLPSPKVLKRKIIIKNKKKHRTHHHTKVNTQPSHSQFHVDLNPITQPRPTEMQGNGEIPRPLMEKEGSRDSSEEENEVANAFPHLARLIGEIPDGGGGEDVESSSSDEENPLTLDDIQEQGSTNPEQGGDAEEEAGAEISALVNYVQPVHFHSFEASEKRNKSYEMSSFVETQASNLLKESPIEFVNYNKRQLSRVYPRGTRVDSSNFLPHQFWNAGCQLVALNYQSLDLAMQLNLGIFEFNCRSGYLLKPDFMRRPDRRFDPFAEATVDGIIAGTVSVKVISGQFLSDKRCGCYIEVEMYGLPADTVRKKFKTKIVQNNCINPVWDEETFVFEKVVLPELATLRIVAYEEGGRASLGHRVLPIVGLRPGYKHITLRNEASQPLGISTLFLYVKVGDYVPRSLIDLAEALANPIKYVSEMDKRAKQLEVFDDDEDTEREGGDKDVPEAPSKQRDSFRMSQGAGGDSSLGTGEDGQKGAARTKSNGEVPDSTSTRESTPLGPRRENSITPRVPLKQSEDKPDRDKEGSLTLLETSKLLNEPETLEKLWAHKTVREKKIELEKNLEKLKKKYEKERQTLEQQQQKKKSQLQKSHSKLVKKYSSGKATDTVGLVKRESSQEFGMIQEELDSRLQELDKAHQATLNELGQALIINEKKLQEKYHEPIFTALEKVMRLSQSAQLKALQNLHDKQVDEIKHQTEEQLREKRKRLDKSLFDKEEFNRKKREISKEVVEKGIKERQQLTDIHDKKKLELEKQHEDIRNQFEEERSKARTAIDTEHDERLRKFMETQTL